MANSQQELGVQATDSRSVSRVRPGRVVSCVLVSHLLAWGVGLSQPPAAQEEPRALALIEAVEWTLEKDPDIQISASQVEAARGSWMIASGLFDTGLTASLDGVDSVEPTGEDSRSESRSLSQSLAASRLLRSGQRLQPSLQLDQVAGDPDVSTGTVAFTFRQPLLQGRDPSAVTAEERAAERDFEASRLDLAHRVAERLLVLVQQYWVARAAVLDLEILRQTESRSREFLATTERLVEADLTPAADLLQLEADLVFREADRIAGEQALFAALQNLGAEIGLEAEEMARLGLPSDPFPLLSPASVAVDPWAFRAEARANRADLAADRERLAATSLRLERARDELKPRLDFILTPAFTGLVEDDGPGDALGAVFRNVPGLSATFGFSYSWPLGNRVATGALLRSESLVEQQALRVEQREIQIDADVPTALDAVRRNAERLEKLEYAVELFTKTLENQEKKLRVGSSTLIDVLNQRDRLTNAQQRLVAVRLALARALATLRFETGTLVRLARGGAVPATASAVRVEDLTTVPRTGGEDTRGQ